MKGARARLGPGLCREQEQDWDQSHAGSKSKTGTTVVQGARARLGPGMCREQEQVIWGCGEQVIWGCGEQVIRGCGEQVIWGVVSR